MYTWYLGYSPCVSLSGHFQPETYPRTLSLEHYSSPGHSPQLRLELGLGRGVSAF